MSAFVLVISIVFSVLLHNDIRIPPTQFVRVKVLNVVFFFLLFVVFKCQ